MKTVTISIEEYESMKQQIAWLMEQLKLSKHKQFGASSEKSDYDQLSLIETHEPEISTPEIEEIKAYRRKKSKHSKDRLPPDLPVEIIEHELPTDE
jgi:transposase